MLYISARAVAKEAWRREGTEFATSANVVAMRVCLCRHPRKCGRVTSPFSSNRTEELWWENPAFWVLKTFSLWLRGVTSSLNFELEQFFKMSQLQSSPLILSGGIGGSVSLWPLGFPVLEFRENKDIWTRGIFFFYHGGVGCRVGWFDVWMRCPAEVNGSNGVLWWESSRPGTQTTWFCSFDVNLRLKWPRHPRLDSSWQSKQGACLPLFWCPLSVTVLRGGCFQSPNTDCASAQNSGKLALFSKNPPLYFLSN